LDNTAKGCGLSPNATPSYEFGIFTTWPLDKNKISCYYISELLGDISIKKRFRLNHQITAPQVRLLGADSSQIGIVSITEAHKIAQEQGYDLAEISPSASPPVVKLLDWGKFQYEQDKQDARNRKKQKSIEVKQVRMGLKIGEHDLEVKRKAARKFLSEGNKVKITARFKGREMTRPDLGQKVIEKFFEPLTDIAQIEDRPSMAGRDMSVVASLTKEARHEASKASKKETTQEK
jgi:translation initiation factor IF-3